MIVDPNCITTSALNNNDQSLYGLNLVFVCYYAKQKLFLILVGSNEVPVCYASVRCVRVV